MKNKNVSDLLNELSLTHDTTAKKVREIIQPLSGEQKLWKPSADRWNVIECFAHLNHFMQYYIPAINQKIELEGQTSKPEEKFTSSHIGSAMYKRARLNNAGKIKRKHKCPKAFNPRFNKKLLQGNDDDVFLQNQKELKQIIEKMKNINLKIKMPMLLSKAIKIRLGDALLFVVAHNERHVKQALNIIDHPKFPK